MHSKITEIEHLNRLSRMVGQLPATLASRVMRSLSPKDRIALANMFRKPVGPRLLTDAEIAARLQARGIDPKFMPQTLG